MFGREIRKLMFWYALLTEGLYRGLKRHEHFYAYSESYALVILVRNFSVMLYAMWKTGRNLI